MSTDGATATARCPYRLDPSGRDNGAEAELLRSTGTVVPIELPGEVQGWAVTSLDALKQLLTDPRFSKDPRENWPAFRAGEIGPDWPLYMWVGVTNMFTSDGEEHHRLRRLVASAFTARRVEALRPRTTAIAEGLLDELAATPPGEVVDLRAKLAYPLPITVICELFGVPEDQRSTMRRLVELLFDPAASEEQMKSSVEGAYGLLNGVVQARRDDPGDDLTTGLIAARDEDGSRLTDQELLDTLWLMLSAGFETTVNLLDTAIFAMLAHPDQLALVQSGTASWDDVVDESLRWAPPVPNMPLRYATEDVELDGVRIPRGQPIIAAFGASGRDPALHGPDHAAFDVTRESRGRHFGFGHGIHFCPGAPLARLELSIAMPLLFGRFPDVRLAAPAEDLDPFPSFLANGHLSIPVRLG